MLKLEISTLENKLVSQNCNCRKSNKSWYSSGSPFTTSGYRLDSVGDNFKWGLGKDKPLDTENYRIDTTKSANEHESTFGCQEFDIRKISDMSSINDQEQRNPNMDDNFKRKVDKIVSKYTSRIKCGF